jgi:proline dehydrogenase
LGSLAKLLDLTPPSLVRLFARPYVAGEGLESALAVARRLQRDAGIVATLDLLAEEVRSKERVAANRASYLEMIRGIASDPAFPSPGVRPTASVKLSSFTTAPLDRGGDGRGAREAAEALAVEAKRLGVPLTVDMEDHHWTDFTLDVAIDLFRRGFDVGTVLQTRLHRTERDLERIPAGMRLRLVIGIYLEPKEIALVDKPAMKERLLTQSARLFDRGVHVEFASHDETTVRRFVAEVVRPRELGGERYEVQMLYGVPRAALLAEILAGRLAPPDRAPPAVRLYVPYATAWDQATAYCRRRLRNNPNMARYVLLNLLQIVKGKSPGIAQYADAVSLLRRTNGTAPRT